MALSVALLTAYFGESGRRPAARAPARRPGGARPDRDRRQPRAQAVRDLFGWVGDTLDAKGENERADATRSSACARELAAGRDGRSATSRSCAASSGLQREEGFPQRHRAGDRAGDRPLAHRLVLERQDRQGLGRRRRGRPAGDRRRRPGRQGHAGHRRHRRGHADHRRVERGLGPGHARGRQRHRQARGGQPERPAARLRREGQARDRGHHGGHLRLHLLAASSRSSRAGSRSAGHAGRPRRARALPARAHQAVRRPAPARLRAGAHERAAAGAGRPRRAAP